MAGWYSELNRIPYDVISKTKDYFIEIAGDKNRIFHLRRYGPGPGRIPRANPDVMTSMCVFDTSISPVEISSVSWPYYWSVSLYGADGDNFYVINDEQFEGRESFTIVIDHKHKPSTEFGVQSPKDTGIMLVRRFVPDETMAEAARAHQDLTFCRASI
jgi:uncharacterized membrane protein